MSYSGTAARTGLGTTFTITPPSGTATAIGEVVDFKQSGRQVSTDDATNMESVQKEFIATLADGGTWELSFNRVSGDTGQLAMETAFAALQTCTFIMTLPKTAAQTTSGDHSSFSAVIQELNYDIETDKIVKGTAKLKVSGGFAWVAGS